MTHNWSIYIGGLLGGFVGPLAGGITLSAGVAIYQLAVFHRSISIGELVYFAVLCMLIGMLPGALFGVLGGLWLRLHTRSRAVCSLIGGLLASVAAIICVVYFGMQGHSTPLIAVAGLPFVGAAILAGILCGNLFCTYARNREQERAK